MKKNICFAISWVIVFLLVSSGILWGESIDQPVAVSPGGETEASVVFQTCPTFSWTAVDRAAAYRVAVFNVEDPNLIAYEDMALKNAPIAVQDIPGRAFSWTLPSEKSLKTGGMYLWFVRAMDAAGNAIGQWSEGKRFNVEEEVKFIGFEETLGEKLREYGISDDVIQRVLGDLKSQVKEVAVRNAGELKKKSSDPGIVQGTEGYSNTFYGTSAGLNTTTGFNNTYIGAYSGYSTNLGFWNTFLGYGAGYYNTTGNYNNFLGVYSGWHNTTGSSNNFFGNYAGYQNTAGTSNSFLGYNAGYSNTTGNNNNFFGNYSGYSTTTGSDNLFFGLSAGRSNTTGNYNNFFGNQAGYGITIGQNNNFMGYCAGYNTTLGHDNNFMGKYAGYRNVTGDNNTYIGSYAGYGDYEGGDNTFIGYYAGCGGVGLPVANVFIGSHAGEDNNDGSYGVIIGNYAGSNNTTGDANSFLGFSAGYSNTSGQRNVFIGTSAGYRNTTANNNSFFGYQAGAQNITGQGSVFLGYQAGYNETGSNKLYIANSNTATPLIYGEFDNALLTVNGKLGIGITPTYPLHLASGAYCSIGGIWTNASSRSLKENIRNLSPVEALDALKQLNPVTFNYKVDKTDQHVGFIAEDVPALLATADRKGLSPMDITAVLTKVVQEQQTVIRNQQKRIDDLEKRITQIEKK
ncbi:MAG: tail fiber domain-containing protein [Candidatus Omnitrophota bacterium]